jgi:hypothetical protein
MKKFLLLLILFAGFSISGLRSQSLSLYSDAGLIPPDGSIGIGGTPEDEEILGLVFVKNNTASTQNVLMKKVLLDSILGSVNSFCFGTNCFSPFVYTSPDAIDIPAGYTDSTFSGHYQPYGHAGTTIIRYVFYLSNNPNDSVSVRAYFMVFPAGVENRTASASLTGIYPNPANNSATVKYAVPGSAKLMVRDILGTIKYNEEISGTGSVAINTSSFSNGMYFCTLFVDGKAGVTKKMIVQH